jgi:hypothetical protein
MKDQKILSDDSLKSKLTIDAALDLWDKGFNIFPLGGHCDLIPEWFKNEKSKIGTSLGTDKLRIEWCKRPTIKWKKFREKPAKQRHIQDWWGSTYPYANIGIITQDLVIVDADNSEAVEWCMENAYSPVRVATCKGYHFYFKKHPEISINCSSCGHRGLDIRAIGGYVVGAGSTHGSGNEYTWDIDPEVSFLSADDLPVMTTEIWESIQEYIGGGKSPKSLPDKKSNFNINDIPNVGGRNDHLARAIGCLISDGKTENYMLEWAEKWNQGLSEPLPYGEVQKTIESVIQTHQRNLKGVADSILKGLEQPDDFDFNMLPKFLSDYIKEAGADTKAHPIMVLSAFLGSLSAAMRHKFYLPGYHPGVEEKQWRGDLHPNIWTIAVADSGFFKSTALNAGAEIIWEKERDILSKIQDLKNDDEDQVKDTINGWESGRNILPNKVSTEGLFDRMSKSGGGVVLASEFGGWLANLEASYNGSLKQTLTNWYDVPMFDEEQTRGKGSLILEKPYIAIAGVSTSKWIKENIDVETAIASGFFARFLLFSPPTRMERPDALPPRGKSERIQKTKMEDVFEYVINKSREEPVLYYLDESARSVFEDCHNEIYDIWENSPKEDQDILSPFVQRWCPYVLKLAMIMQVIIDKDADIISGQALRASYHIVKYSISSTAWLIKHKLTISDFQDLVDKVLNYIANKGAEVTRAVLTASRSLPGDTKQYDRVIDFLESAGKLKITKVGKKSDEIYTLLKA